MDFLQKLAKALELDEGATEDQVLEALTTAVTAEPLADVVEALELDEGADTEKVIEAIKALAADGEGEKSLADRAKAEGKVVVDQTEYAGVVRDAKAGREAADELHQTKFDTAFDKALDGARVATSDETRERLQKFYDADPEACIEFLDNSPQLANTQARGSGKGKGETPDGVDPDAHELDQRVQAYMREHKVDDYAEALDKILDEEGES